MDVVPETPNSEDRQGNTHIITHAEKIRADVKQMVSNAHTDGVIRNRVVTALAEEQISERTSILLRMLSKRDEKVKEINKIRPDNVTFTPDGQKTENYTKEQYEKLKRAREELSNFDKAIAKAEDDADYESIKKILGGQKSEPTAS